MMHFNFNSAVVLSWKQYLNIIGGVASALTYRHEECKRKIIHRDVKTCNIMLDADFNAKLGDFGLEYFDSGVPTVKTDVYSSGVVVLEVGTGGKPFEDDGTVVVNYVWNLWEKRKLIEAADRRLMH